MFQGVFPDFERVEEAVDHCADRAFLTAVSEVCLGDIKIARDVADQRTEFDTAILRGCPSAVR